MKDNKIESIRKYEKYRAKKAKYEKGCFRDFLYDQPVFFFGSIIVTGILLIRLIISLVGE